MLIFSSCHTLVCAVRQPTSWVPHACRSSLGRMEEATVDCCPPWRCETDVQQRSSPLLVKIAAFWPVTVGRGNFQVFGIDDRRSTVPTGRPCRSEIVNRESCQIGPNVIGVILDLDRSVIKENASETMQEDPMAIAEYEYWRGEGDRIGEYLPAVVNHVVCQPSTWPDIDYSLHNTTWNVEERCEPGLTSN